MKYLSLLILLASCSSMIRIPTIRSPYSLTTNNGFIVSNIYTNPTELEHQGHNVVINYDLVIKNITESTRDINLKSAEVAFREITIPMTCSSFDKKESEFKLSAQQTARIQCKAVITKNNNPGDTKIFVQIPLEKSFANFTYIVRAEDFQ